MTVTRRAILGGAIGLLPTLKGITFFACADKYLCAAALWFGMWA